MCFLNFGGDTAISFGLRLVFCKGGIYCIVKKTQKVSILMQS